MMNYRLLAVTMRLICATSLTASNQDRTGGRFEVLEACGRREGFCTAWVCTCLATHNAATEKNGYDFQGTSVYEMFTFFDAPTSPIHQFVRKCTHALVVAE